MRMRWWLHTGVVSLLALLAVVIFKVSSQPLSDEQLRDVQGRESIFVMPEPTLSTDVVTQALMRFFDGRVFALDLSAESFQSAWLQAAGTTLEASLYDGRGVTQLMVVAPPSDYTFSVNQVLQQVGGHYNGGNVGELSINRLDMSGARIWVWSH